MDPIAYAAEIRGRLAAGKRVEQDVPGFQRAAVLLPLCPSAEGPIVLLTRRTEEVETHKGQISLPGGVMEIGDRDAVHTALREAEEEVGLLGGELIVAGLLDDHVTPTGFVITPVVAVCRALPHLHINPREVAELLRIPLASFGPGADLRSEFREVLGRNQEVHFYRIGSHVVWGATAAIIRNLLRQIGSQEASASFSGRKPPPVG